MTALPALAELGDLEAWLGRDPAPSIRASAVLSQASNRVRAYCRRTWVDDSGALTDDVPAIVVDVVVRVAARAFDNREGLDSVTLDDGTKRWGSVRGLALSDEDREDLREHRLNGAPAGVGVMSTYRGDEGYDDTLYVPTGPPPSGYPFPWYSAADL